MSPFDGWIREARQPDGEPLLSWLLFTVADRDLERFRALVDVVENAFEAGRTQGKVEAVEADAERILRADKGRPGCVDVFSIMRDALAHYAAPGIEGSIARGALARVDEAVAAEAPGDRVASPSFRAHFEHMRGALKFYADNWILKPLTAPRPTQELLDDAGSRASIALNAKYRNGERVL